MVVERPAGIASRSPRICLEQMNAMSEARARRKFTRGSMTPVRQGVEHSNHAHRNRYPLARRNCGHELDDVWRLLGNPENTVTFVSVGFPLCQSAQPSPV